MILQSRQSIRNVNYKATREGEKNHKYFQRQVGILHEGPLQTIDKFRVENINAARIQRAFIIEVFSQSGLYAFPK